MKMTVRSSLTRKKKRKKFRVLCYGSGSTERGKSKKRDKSKCRPARKRPRRERRKGNLILESREEKRKREGNNLTAGVPRHRNITTRQNVGWRLGVGSPRIHKKKIETWRLAGLAGGRKMDQISARTPGFLDAGLIVADDSRERKPWKSDSE